MKHQQHQTLDLQRCFPWDRYPTMLPVQEKVFDVVQRQGGSVILELPTGSGKTAIGYTVLKALAKKGATPLFYIAPNKALVDQVQRFHPDVCVAYGRGEYPCLYYPNRQVTADDVPCSLLLDCAHRVDQESGATFWAGETPCPYLQQKFLAKRAPIIVCTTAFYLFTQLFSKEWPIPQGLVIDEVHSLARTVRSLLSYEITDYHLRQVVGVLERIGVPEAKTLDHFLKVMIEIIQRRSVKTAALLEAHEIRQLMDILIQVDAKSLHSRVGEAIRSKAIDPFSERSVMKRLETVVFDLRRYLHSFEYSLATPQRHPLNYTFAYYEKERPANRRSQYHLYIKSYYVAPIIQRILSPFTVAYSATIGDPQMLAFETGIRAPFYQFGSGFSAARTRIYMPINTSNLAVKERKRGEPTRSLNRIVRAVRELSTHQLGSLVLVVSELERTKFLQLCQGGGVDAVSYGAEQSAREAAVLFKSGVGEVLVGTVTQFGQGLDLPAGIAPVTFVLRPSYPPPNDPATIFEERRFGSMRWNLWTWRAMIEALQARGRNIRSVDDIGVTIFVSQQFRRFVFGSLPQWLQSSYRGDWTFEQCIAETITLCNGKK